jgi:hypothetical protein
MSVESLTYADLADRLGTSREAARSVVRRLRLPRLTANDGTVRVNVDLTEIQYTPAPRRSPGGHRADFEVLKARAEQLQAEVVRFENEKSSIEAVAARHRTDFERERVRSDRLMANTMALAAVATSARAKAARLESELASRRFRLWFRPGARAEQPSADQTSPKPKGAIMQVDKKGTPWCEPPLSRMGTIADIAALVLFAALITAFVEYGIPFLVQ